MTPSLGATMKRDDEEDGIANAILNALLIAVIIGFMIGSFAVLKDGPIRSNPWEKAERKLK